MEKFKIWIHEGWELYGAFCFLLFIISLVIGIIWGVFGIHTLLAPTSVTAYIATYIAYQQFLVHRQQARFAQYERKLRVYEEVKTFIVNVASERNLTMETISKFHASTSEADFIFSKVVRDYIEELVKRAHTYLHWKKQYRDISQPLPVPSDYDHQKVVEGMDNEVVWFTGQLEPARNLFQREMRLT